MPMPGRRQEDPGTSAILAFRFTRVNVKEFALFTASFCDGTSKLSNLLHSSPIISWPIISWPIIQLANHSRSWRLPGGLIAAGSAGVYRRGLIRNKRNK